MGDTHKKNEPIECTMSLGDHLEELRARILLAIVGLVIGAAVSLIFGTRIIRFIEKPYIDVIHSRYIEPESSPVDANTVGLVDVVFTTLGAALESDPNAPEIDPADLAFFHRVFNEAYNTWRGKAEPKSKDKAVLVSREYGLQVLTPAEAFVSYMKISFIAGLILTCPWVFYQLWMFVAAGLYPHERQYVRTAVPFSAALFVIGALFFLFIVAPLSLKFFLVFGDLLGVSSNWTLQGYISFVTMLMLVFGLAFQMPIAIFILARTRLVSLEALRRVRKFVFLSVFVVAAIATPPDVISQVTLAVPLYGLYELGILLASLVGDKEAQARAKANAKLMGIVLLVALIGWGVSLMLWVYGQAIAVKLLGGAVTKVQSFLFLGRPHCLYEDGLAASRQAMVTIAGLLAPVLAGWLGLLVVPFKRFKPRRALCVSAFFVPLMVPAVEWLVFPIMHLTGRDVAGESIAFITQSGFQPLIVAAIGLGLTVVSYRLFRRRTQFVANLKSILS